MRMEHAISTPAVYLDIPAAAFLLSAYLDRLYHAACIDMLVLHDILGTIDLACRHRY